MHNLYFARKKTLTQHYLCDEILFYLCPAHILQEFLITPWGEHKWCYVFRNLFQSNRAKYGNLMFGQTTTTKVCFTTQRCSVCVNGWRRRWMHSKLCPVASLHLFHTITHICRISESLVFYYKRGAETQAHFLKNFNS